MLGLVDEVANCRHPQFLIIGTKGGRHSPGIEREDLDGGRVFPVMEITEEDGSDEGRGAQNHQQRADQGGLSSPSGIGDF